MTPALRFSGTVVVFILLYLILSGRCFGEEEKIVKITILGNEKFSEDMIRGHIKSRENESLSIPQLRKDLKSIYETGFFADVIVDLRDMEEGKEVIFIVVEKPSIRNILISGNEKIEASKIMEKIDITTGAIVNMDKLKQTVDNIKGLYSSKAYYRAKVDHHVHHLDGNEVDIEFTIEEGKKGYIKKVRFQGNKHFSARKLRKRMKTKKKGWFSWFTGRGAFDEDVLKGDMQNLQALYFDNGYIQVKIDKPEITITEDGKWIYIDITIHEGEQFKVGEIDFTGDILTTREDLFKRLSLERGKVYRTSLLQEDIMSITFFYGERGYAYVDIAPLTSLDSEKKLVHLTFDIHKGQEVYFEQITISGNTKTRDKVIRRELRAAEGDLYSSKALKRGRQKLMTSGYFMDADFTTSKGTSDEKINLDIKVEEGPTGTISFGGGYSTVEGAVGMIQLSERNLLGLGYKTYLNTTLGAETERFRFGFTNPWLLGTPTTAGLDVYVETSEVFDTYKSDITGVDAYLGRYMTDYISARLTGRFERVKINDVSPDASRFIAEQEGTRDTHSLSLSLTKDTRDSYFNPTKGSKHTLSLENAGWILGGDNTFYKVIGDTNWYFPMPLDTVLHLRGRSGIVEGYDGRDVPIYERFFIGGINTIRGFEYGMAGPKDETGEAIGGEKMVIFNSELLFPLRKDIGLKGAVFYDAGKGFDEFREFGRVNHSVGFGIRWFSPIGPLRIDWGYNLDPQAGEQQGITDFTIGTQF
ncbi:MAG: outer membrane protein assembly factor BamA [Syntrophobacterales bacterium]|nr:MAG: outer membrane protein assembly factor BamA [Syntrophobacterales bacterium]